MEAWTGGTAVFPSSRVPKVPSPLQAAARAWAGAWLSLLGLPSPLAVAVQGQKPPVPPLSLPFLPLPLPRLCSLLRALSLGVGGFSALEPDRSPFSTGPFILRSLILFTERLFSLTCIWVNQSLQQHLITAWALYVGEIMKHLISERNIKVQKDSSGRKWREITSFCTQPTSPSPFQIGWDSFCCPFCFCLEFNI